METITPSKNQVLDLRVGLLFSPGECRLRVGLGPCSTDIFENPIKILLANLIKQGDRQVWSALNKQTYIISKDKLMPPFLPQYSTASGAHSYGPF
jgi:hypothetical protein